MSSLGGTLPGEAWPVDTVQKAPRQPPANQNDARALRIMPKKPPVLDCAGPMRMQPSAHGPIAATQMLPLMPGARTQKKEMNGETRQRAPAEQKERPTRAEAVRAAWARITRRKALRKQRAAQKG